MMQQEEKEQKEHKEEKPKQLPAKGQRLPVSKNGIHVFQLSLAAVGIWWAFYPAQQDLAQAQIPGFLIALAISWWLTLRSARGL